MSYLKNVGKSIGYAIPAIIEDKFKDLGQLSKMVANPKEFKTLFKDSVKDMLNDTSSDMNSEIIAPIKKMYNRAEKAAKTGNYFRSEKERTASAFEAFGGDFNMDFDFNTDSLESSIDDSTEATYENTNAIYETGVMQVATTSRATKSITSELSRLSSLTYELSKLQTELTRTQISEAGRYYASSLGFLGEMNESMSALKNEMVALRMVSAPPDIFKGPNAQKYYEVLTASNFNMRSYFNYLGKKAKDSSAYSFMSLAGMGSAMFDPIESAFKMMFSPIVDSKFGKRMQALNKAIAGSPLFVLRALANKNYGDSLLGKGISGLFKFLNVDYIDSDKQVNLKTDIRTVPWDAESKRSLVQVIPNLLSRILSAVKKEDFNKRGLVFDPNTGKYIKMQELGDRMKETVDKATDYDSFSQNEIIKKMRESQTFTGDDKAKEKQKKSFDNQIYKMLDVARLAGNGNFDINKAISEGRYTSPKEIELAKHMHEQFFSNLSVDKYNSMLELLNHHEARKDNIIGTIKGLYEDKKDKFGTAERQFEGNLFDEISKKYYNIDNKKIKDLRNNNGGNGDSSNDNNNNNNGGGGNPPANDSFFDKMRKLIDGSYLFTKLNGFLDTISEKTSKFIFGDDTFVGPKKSFFQSLKEGIKEKFDKFSEVFKETFEPLKDYFTQTLIPNLSNAFQGIKKYLVDDIYKGIMGGHTITGQGGIITNIKESIKGKVNKAKEYLMGTKDNQGVETSEGAFKKIYKSLGFESIFNKFKDGVRSLGDVLKENTEKLAKFFNKHLFEDGGLLKGLGDKISTFFKDTTDTIKKDILTPLKEFLVGDDGILTKAKENIKQNILSPIRDFFVDKDNGIFNDAFKLKFRNIFIQPIEDFFLGKGNNKQNIFKRLMGKLNKDMFFGKEKKYNVNGIQATAGGMFGDSNSFLYKFLFGTSSVDAAGKVNKNTKGLIDNISEKGVGKFLIEKLSETVFKPFSKYLMGDDNKPGILRKFATYLDDNIANPIKSFLFGDENKEGALDKFKNSFNVFLFGDGTEKRKGVIGDYLKPATDFLKVELMDPFLDTMRKQWFNMKTFFREGVLEPLMTSFDGLGTSIGIKISKLGRQGKDYFVDAFKSTLEITNEAIGNMLSGSSKTLTEMMKENVLDPIKSTLDKLRLGIWSILKGIIKIPVNAFSAVTDRIKIADLLKGDGGHLSKAQQARLLEVHNKSLREKDRLTGWGEQKEYFGEDGEPKKKGFFRSIFDRTHDKVREREEKVAKENKDSKSDSKISLDRSEDYKKNKMLKDISTKESANDIKNLSENSDKSTKTLSEVLEVLKNPIPEITTNIKDIKDGILNYIREHSLSNSKDTTSSSSSDKSTEDKEKTKELKESKKEIKSTNGLLTDIRDGIDTMIHILSGGKDGASSREGANLRGKRRFGGGSIGRILEGLILDPLGMIRSVFEGGFKAIADSIGGVFKIVTEPLVQLTKTIGTGVREFFKLIGKTGGLIDGISNLGGKVLTGLGDLISGVSGGIKILLEDGAKIFGGIAKNLGTVLGDISVSLGKVISSTVDILEGITKTLKPLTDFMFKFIGQTIGLLGSGILGGMKVAKWGAEKTGGWLLRRLGIDIGKDSNLIKKVSIDGGMLTGISDVVRVFVVGGNLDGISNKVNSGGMDTSKLSSNSKSGESLKDVVNKTKADLTRPDDYKKKKDSKDDKKSFMDMSKLSGGSKEEDKKKKNSTGGIGESLVNMRDNVTTKLKDLRDKLMLSNSSKTVEHLSEIRKDGKGLLGMLFWALPALIGSVGSLLAWLGITSVASLITKPIAGIAALGTAIKTIPSKVGGVVAKAKASPANIKGWWNGTEATRASMTGGVTEARAANVGMKQKLLDTKTNITEGFNNKKASAKKRWSGEAARNADFAKGDMGTRGSSGVKTRLSNAKMNLDSSKLGRKAFDVKGLKGLGVGLALAGTGYVADKYMEEGFTKDVLVAGSDIAGYALTGAAIGSFIPLIGNAIGGTIGAMYGISQNLGRIANIAKATWTFIAGKGAEFDENGNMVKESELSIFDRILGNGAQFDKNRNVIEKEEGSILDIVKHPLDFLFFGSEGLKNEKGQWIREAKKGLFGDFFYNIAKPIGEMIGAATYDFVDWFSNIQWKEALKWFGGAILDIPKNIIKTIYYAIDAAFSGIGSLFSGVGGYLGNLFGGNANEKMSGILLEKDRTKGNSVLQQLTDSGATDSHGFFSKNTSINEDTINQLSAENAKAILSSDASLSNSTRDSLQSRLDSLNNPIKRAKGGIVLGKGTETSDSIPTMLSNNEYVVNAKAVKAIGKPTLDKINKLGKDENTTSLTDVAINESVGAGLVGAKSYVNRKKVNLSKVKPKAGIGGMLLSLAGYFADNNMDEGLLKDITVAGTGIAGDTLTGAVVGPEGAIAGLIYGIYNNLEKLEGISNHLSGNNKKAVKRAKGGIVTSEDANLEELNNIYYGGEFSENKKNIKGVSSMGLMLGSLKGQSFLKNIKNVVGKGGLASLAYLGKYANGMYNKDGLLKDTIDVGLDVAGSGLTGSMVGPMGTLAGTAYGVNKNRDKINKLHRGYVDYTSENIIPAIANFFMGNDSFFSDIKRNIDATSKGIDNFFFGKDAKYDKNGKLISRKEDGLIKKTGEIFGKLGDWFNGLLNSDFFKSVSNTVSNIGQGISNVGQSVVTGAKEAYSGAVNATSGVFDKMFSGSKENNSISFFQSQGWTKEQASGIVANLMTESKLDPKAIGDSGKAYGIAQWHPDRQANFLKAFGHKIQDSTLEEQLQFVNYELTRGTEKGAGNKLRAATSASQAGSIVSKFYERPLATQKEMSVRGAYSDKLFGSSSSSIRGINGNIAVDNNQGYLGDDGKKGEGTTTVAVTNKISPSGNKIGGGTSGFSSGNPNSLNGVKFAHSDIHLNKVHPELYNRFGKLAAEYKAKFGKDLVLNSAWRSVEKQAALAKASGNSKMVAPPGHSMHNFGYALDVNKVGPGQNPMIPDDMLAKYGLYRPMMSKGLYEPWHIELNETKGVRSKISREGYVPSIGSSGQLNLHDTVSNLGSDAIVGKNSVNYSNISSNNPETDKNIAITNASTDVKGLVIKDAITEQTNSYNNMSEEGNGTKNNSQSSVNTSRIEALLETIARNTGETAKKDFSVKVPENGDKKNINLFEGNNTKINPYASYIDNSKMKVMDKRLEQANKIARGT